MADPFPTGNFIRIIYERGLQVLRAEEGWLIPSSERLQRVEYPDELESAFGVRRIICDTHFNVPFFQPRRLLDPFGKPVSRARYLKGYVEDSHRRIYKYMVEHHLYCAVAHLGYLTEAYAGLAVLDNRNRWGLPDHVLEHSRTQLHDSALRHGEAVFTSLCSAFDASRFLLWRENRSPPATLPATLDMILTSGSNELRALVAGLEEVWYEEGPRVTEYRDCAASFHPITELGGRCGGVLNDGDVWEMRIDLPDNPGTKRREQFTFDQQIDLLEYSWTTTCRIVRVIEETLPPVYELAEAGREPSRWSWLTDG